MLKSAESDGQGLSCSVVGNQEKNEVGMVIATIDTELLLLADLKTDFDQKGNRVMVSDRQFVEMCRDKRNTGAFFGHHGIRVPKEVD